METNNDELTRREFVGVATGGIAVPSLLEGQVVQDLPKSLREQEALSVKINGQQYDFSIDTRRSLLDLLREQIHLNGTKKGCDHGQCGACTVIVDGQRILSCLTLAVTQRDAHIITIEGLSQGNTLHPMQAAFMTHDAFQCGYCTPGQICSAVAMLDEVRSGMPSAVSETGNSTHLELSEDEIRERMSGNICRCGAYPNIVAAIRQVERARQAA